MSAKPTERLPARPLTLAVVGAAACSKELGRTAYEVGRQIARQGATLLCGGRSGVMERTAAGAKEAGGETVGILPGRSATETPPNKSIDLPIYTGLGQARNQVLVLSADAVIAVGGGWGTLSEIGLAMKHGIPVVLVDSWRLHHPGDGLEEELHTAAGAAEAVAKAVAAAGRADLPRAGRHGALGEERNDHE